MVFWLRILSLSLIMMAAGTVSVYAQSLSGAGGGGSNSAAVGRLQGQIDEMQRMLKTQTRDLTRIATCNARGMFYRPDERAADEDGCIENEVNKQLVSKMCPDQHFVAGFDERGRMMCRKAQVEPLPWLVVSHAAPEAQCDLLIARHPLTDQCSDGDIQNIRSSNRTEYSNPACGQNNCCTAFNIDVQCVDGRWEVFRAYRVTQNGVSAEESSTVFNRVEYRR